MVPEPDKNRKDMEESTKLGRRKPGLEGSKGEPDVTAHPTPIWISRRTRTALLLATIAALAYAVYWVPDVLAMTVGGVALALILSFPVGFLSRLMSQGLAILLSFVPYWRSSAPQTRLSSEFPDSLRGGLLGNSDGIDDEKAGANQPRPSRTCLFFA